MNRYNYDFSGLETATSHLRQRQDIRTMNEIKTELNKFFKDSNCKEVIFTKNTDKLFFGMTTYFVLEDPEGVILDDKPMRIKEYYIEIDSKLLDLGLSKKELTAVLLHEVGHLVNDSTPIDEVRKAIDVYMAENREQVSIGDIYNNNRFFTLAIRDSIRKMYSIFTRKDEEILADEFVVMCGYGEYLESAYKKIVASTNHINKNVSNKLLTLDWTFKVYKNMKYYRNIALRVLNKSKGYTGSKYEKKEIDEAIDNLKKVDVDNIRECSVIYEAIKVDGCSFRESEDMRNNKSFIGRIRHRGLRGLEEDVYEYQMRIRNVEDTDDAINLMRQINSRMAVLDDYLSSCGDIPEKEIQRWEKCLSKYDILREELAKKTVYNRKNYGLWFDMNYANAMNPS